MLDSRPRGRGFEPHRRNPVVSLSKNIYLSLVLVQPRKIRPFITERLLMGHKESNKKKKIEFRLQFQLGVVDESIPSSTSLSYDTLSRGPVSETF